MEQQISKRGKEHLADGTHGAQCGNVLAEGERGHKTEWGRICTFEGPEQEKLEDAICGVQRVRNIAEARWGLEREKNWQTREELGGGISRS